MNDPAQDLYLALRRDQDDAVQKAALSFATPWNAQNLVDYSNAYPLGSSELGLGLTIAGIPGNSRDINPLVQQEMEESPVLGPIKNAGGGWWDDLAGIWDEWVDNPLKGTTRWGFSAWDAAYNMIAGGAPIRAWQQAETEGTDFNTAWQEQDPYFFEALGGLFAGEKVNLGSGWLPSSDVATDVRQNVNEGMMGVERATEHLDSNEKYSQRLEAAPGVWKNAVAGSLEQAEMGRPLTELAHVAAESVMFNVTGMAGSVKTPWSPGRIAAAHILEPGTEPFSKVSGFGDFAAQIFLDPADWIGIAWMKAGIKGRTVLAQADKVARQMGPIGPTRRFDIDEPAYGFRTIEQLDLPMDPSLTQMEQIKIATGDAPLHPYESASTADGLPVWTDPDQGKVLGPGDPPEFYVDHIQQQLEEARRAKATQKVTKVEAGFYTMADEVGNPIHIQKVDGKWLVTDETGQVISEGHKTLKAATASVAADFDAAKVGAEFNGMSIDEFSRTGEDLVLDDGVGVLPTQVDEYNGRSTESPIHTASPEAPQTTSPAYVDGPVLYHGSSGVIDAGPMGPAGESSRNIYGPGFYTTDDIGIAGTYATRGAAEQVTSVRWTGIGEPKILDMEVPLPARERAVFRNLGDSSLLDDMATEHWDEFIRIVDNKSSTGDDIYRAFRDLQEKSGLSKGSADELHDMVNFNISQNWDVLRHLGGKRTGGKAHNVHVWLDPESLINAGKVDDVSATTRRLDELVDEIGTQRSKYAEESVKEGYFGTPEAKAATKASAALRGEQSKLISRYISESRKAGTPIDSRRINSASKWDEVADDDIITVYHATDPETAARIRNEGLSASDKKVTPELQQGYEAGQTPEGLYVSSDPNVGGMYGGPNREIVELQIRKGDLSTPRELNRQGVYTDKPESERVFIGLSTDRWGAVLKGDIPAQKAGVVTDGPAHTVSQRGTGNTKVRVFGHTADGTGQASKLDEGLQAALRKDRKIRNGFVVGFGNPDVEKWAATKAWMRENGYGKLKLDNDRYLILDEYIGGNKADPYGRSWQTDGSQPISTLSAGDGVMGSRVTADEVNKIIDWVIENGATKTRRQVQEAVQVGDVSVAEAEKIMDAVRQSEEARTVLQGVRPDFDELATTNSLSGKRSGMLIDRITSATKKGGQSSPRILDDLLKVFERKGVIVPISLRRSLYDAGSREEVQVLLAKWLASEGGGSVLLRGGGGKSGFGRLTRLTDVADETLSMKITSQIGKTIGSPLRTAAAVTPGITPRKPRVSLSDKPWFARRITYGLPSEPINMVDEPDKAYQVLNNILPNFNLNRGSVVELFDDAGELSGRTVSVESLFERLRQGAGRKDVAYDLMGDFSEVFFSQLVADGVDAKLAKHAKKWWNEVKTEAIYEAERLGMTGVSPGQGDLALVGEHQIHGLGPQNTAQAWDGTMHFPDSKTMRLISNESDMLGQLANKFTSKVEADEMWGGATLQSRTWKRYADFTMNSVWKPLVLLRFAWTIRIAIDDQLRIAGDGYGLFRHPWRLIQYGTTMPKSWWDLFKKGQMDINGEMMSIQNISNMMHEDFLRKAVFENGGDVGLGPGSNGFRHTVSVGRGGGGTPPAKYINGLTTDIKQLRASTITKVLAGSTSDDAVGEAVEFLLGRGPESTRASGVRAREELAHIHSRMSDPKDPNSVKARLLAGSDEQLLREVVEKQWATLHQKTGGVVYLDNGDGVALNFGNLEIRPGMEQGTKEGRAVWVVETPGDKDLLSVIAGKNLYGDLNTEESMRVLEKALGSKVKANPDTFPKIVRVTDETRAMYPDDLQQTYGKALRMFFDWFMAKPSDMLSRQPLFRRAYHKRMGDMYPYMDDALQRAYRKNASKADIKYAEAQVKVTGKLDIGGQLTSLEQADGLAKAYGLSQVETTLFRVLDSKRNISEALNLIFPFVEAWGEFMSRWGRIMVTGDKSMANARRFQQGIEGARDSGFFYENEFGQEVFNYPAFLTKAQIKVHNMLNDIPIAGNLLGENIDPAVEEAVTQGSMFKPADAGVKQQSSVTGSVEGMNFASSVIPGFGPVFQLGAKQILPDDPAWDNVREMISPFGTEGSVAGSLMPAWLKRVSASLGGGNDPQLSYQYTSTVQDIINTQINSGQWENITSQAEVTAKVKEAEDQARALLMVRAAATYWTPTSPQYKFQAQDKDGMVWSYTNLGNEFYKIKEEAGGNEGVAFEEFHRRFGLLPSAFSGPGRTYAIEPRSQQELGYKFERSNSALFDAYPGTAMYLDPNVDVDSEYDHDATLRQLKLGLRESWSGEQLIYLKQDQLGSIMWENVTKAAQNDKAAGIKGDVIDARRSASREEIKSLYPHWGEKVPGTVQRFTSEQKMAEVMEWMNNPGIAGTPVARAARRYLWLRDEALRVIADLGGKSLGSTSSTSDQGKASIELRKMLRDAAVTIEGETPQFGPLFKAVFAYEVRSDIDGPTIIEKPLFGDSKNIFDDHLGEAI